MIKQVLFFCSLLIIVTGLSAQSSDAGKNYYYYQRYASAENYFHDQLKQQPDNAETWLWLVKSYVAENELQKATDSFSLAPASVNGDPYYLIGKGTLALQQGMTDNARTYFDQAIDMTKSKNATVLGLVADAETNAEKMDSSYTIETIMKAIKRDKKSGWLYVVMGNAFLKMHDGGEAYKAYTEAIDKDSHNAEACYQLGKIFQSQKNPEMYLDYFNKAVAADPNYAPAWYELYSHYLYTAQDPQKAMDYFAKYTAVSDPSLQQEYSRIDLLYLTKDYQQAISGAKQMLDKPDSQPRLYKLIGYSYEEMKDTADAITWMEQYFKNEADSNFIEKDFETMGDLYSSREGKEDAAIEYYQKAIGISKDSTYLTKFYKKLSVLSKDRHDYAGQAKWLGKYYQMDSGASNVDLFNWGLAAYRAGDYAQADTVFGIYTSKYPEQGFGYYWRARSNAAIDTMQEEGLAVPYYQKLTEVVYNDSLAAAGKKLTATDKKWLIESYSYLAAYETNTQKDYKEAMDYFGKVLEIDPENTDAKKYIAILENNLKTENGSN